jgi:hypothetical protein
MELIIISVTLLPPHIAEPNSAQLPLQFLSLQPDVTVGTDSSNLDMLKVHVVNPLQVPTISLPGGSEVF